jgi:NADH:ubiquinone oxidoreductase subunit C
MKLTLEEDIAARLEGKFKLPDGGCVIQRQRRITAEVSPHMLISVMEYMKQELGFTMLCTITGLDIGENLQAIYHLANELGVVLNIKLSVPKANPVLSSVTAVFEGAVLYERELMDLLGFKIDGIPPGSRYPLPDTWPESQYPLLKDWKPTDTDLLKGGKRNE